MLVGLTEVLPVLKSLQFAVLALFVYDYLLTLPSEVELVWSRKFRISTAIYFIIRYLPMINILFAIAKTPLQHCTWVLTFVLSWVIVIRVAINATLIAKVYAVCSLNYILPSIVAALGVSEIVFDSMTVSCHPSYKWQLGILISRLSFEGMVIIITVVQTVRNFTLHNSFGGRGLAGFVVAQGIIHFIAVFSLEIFCLAVFRTQIQPWQLPGASGSYPLPVAAILIAHFHLDLRRRSKPLEEEKPTAGRTISTIFFISRHVQSSFIDEYKGPDALDSSRTDQDANVHD